MLGCLCFTSGEKIKLFPKTFDITGNGGKASGEPFLIDAFYERSVINGFYNFFSRSKAILV